MSIGCLYKFVYQENETATETGYNKMSYAMRKPVFGFLTKSDTNWAAQPQEMAKGLKFEYRMQRDCTK